MLFGVEIHAFVLLPNHFHLLVTTPNENLGKVMEHALRSVAKTLNRLSGRIGHTFGGRYRWSTLGSPRDFACALKYAYREPIDLGLSQAAEAYPYSTLRGLLGERLLTIKIHFPFGRTSYEIIPADLFDQFAWINRPFPNGYKNAILGGLKKPRFIPPLGKRQAAFQIQEDLI